MRPERRATLACALALFAASFLARYPLARTWFALGVLDQHDVLFDADPVVFLQAFRDGDMRDRLWRAHPNVRNLVNPAVRLAGRLARVARPDWTVERARGEAALLVAPAASGVTTALVFLTLRLLGGTLGAAALGAVVEMCSFSGLVFGSIPESYPLSGAALAAALLLLAEAARPGGRLRVLPWILVASTAFGITSTNLGLVGIPLFVAASRALGSRLRAGAATVAVLLAAVALGIVELLAVNAAYREHLPLRKIARTDPFLAARPLETARSFPEAVVSTVLPDRPAVVTSEIGLRRDYPFKLMFTVGGEPQSLVSKLLRGLVVAGFLLLGALQLARLGGPGPPVLWAALGILAFNLVLHSWYRGPDLLLYSMHWHAALAVVIGAAALAPRRAAAALLACALAFNNVSVLWWMVRTLRAMA
jgi:hypothetical protein